MKTLSSSYFMFHPCKFRCNDTVSGPSFLAHQNHFTLNVSLQNIRCSHSISAVPPHTQTADESENYQIINTDVDQLKTVQVRFKLHKECAFGQQFLLVGDEPVIGLWEPSHGAPLLWSDGHFWTAQVDLPIGKVINYKFVLKEESGTVSWQLGPDRLLKTWDTEKGITVFEDWDNSELQKIVESDLNEEVLVESDLEVVDENLSLLVTDERRDVDEELDSDYNGENSIEEKTPALLVAENIVEKEHADNYEIIGNDNNVVGSDDETRLITVEGVPVLVPGLVSIAREEIEEKVEKEHDKSTTSNLPIVFVSEVDREHDNSTTSNVPNVVVSQVESEHDKSTTSDVPSVLVSEVENEHNKSTTSDVPSALVSRVEKEHGKSTTSDVPSALVSKVENEHDKRSASDVPNLFVSKVETEDDKCTTSNVPNDVEELVVSELKEEHVSDSLDSTEIDQEIDKVQEEEKRVLYNVLKEDKHWGRQALQKFLASLGFQIS